MSPSLENWDSSFAAYVWHIGFPPLTARREKSSRSAISSIVALLKRPKNKSPLWAFYRVFLWTITKPQGLGAYVNVVFLSTNDSICGVTDRWTGLLESLLRFMSSLFLALPIPNSNNYKNLSMSLGISELLFILYFISVLNFFFKLNNEQKWAKCSRRKLKPKGLHSTRSWTLYST